MQLINITKANIDVYAPMMKLEAIEDSKNPEGVIALGVSEASVACGAIVIELRECAANILSLYVLPEYRRKGYGTELMIAAADVAIMCDSVVGFKVEFTEDLVEDNGLKPFFEFCGLHMEKRTDIGCYCCQLGDIAQNAILNQNMNVSIKTYDALSRAEKNHLLMEPPYYMEYYMKENLIDPYMSGFITENEHIQACCVFVNRNDELSLEWLRGDAKNHMATISLLQHAMGEAKKKYPMDTRMVFPIVNEQSQRLLVKLLGDSVVQIEATWTGTMLFDEEE